MPTVIAEAAELPSAHHVAPADPPQATWPLPNETPVQLRTIPFGVFFDGQVPLVAGSTRTLMLPP